MKIDLMKKKFQKEIEMWLSSESLSYTAAGWLLNVSGQTVSNYVNGVTLPNRNTALLLAFFEPKLKDVLERIAGLPAAQGRYEKQNRKAA
jgi:hypothetical protein